MTSQEAIKHLEAISRDTTLDVEKAHEKADKVLTDFMLSLGYQRLIRAYDDIEKVYL